jgi:anti-sigma-K factor RskA
VRLRRDVPHTLAGAYALDALTGPDRARFEHHLAGCEVCRQEAAGLREAAAQLPAAVAAAPPPQLRDRVLAAARVTRQQPPGIASPGPGQRTLGLVPPRMAVAIAGGCLLVALAFGGLFADSQHRLHLEQAHSGAIAAVLNAPDAAIMTARAAAGGSATVVMSRREHALVLTTAHLPALAAGQRYQVWLMGQHRMRPAGMLPGPRRGMTAPVVVFGVAAGDSVGLTVEPASGARSPTSAPVLMVALPS